MSVAQGRWRESRVVTWRTCTMFVAKNVAGCFKRENTTSPTEKLPAPKDMGSLYAPHSMILTSFKHPCRPCRAIDVDSPTVFVSPL